MFLGTMRRMSLGLVCGLLLAGTTPRRAALHVPDEYATIGEALAAARHGDRIIVADGVYTGPENRDLDFAGKRIRLVSENGPDNCIIDCEQQGRAFHIHSGEPPAVTLEGFTIQNGLVEADSGGAILCDGSSLTIRNCVFRWNTVAANFQDGGGAVAALNGASIQLVDCAFIENAQINGGDNGAGALAVAWESRALVVRCAFTRNSASLGGAVAVPFDSHAQFRDCVFSENTAEDAGGGLSCTSGSMTELKNCEFIGNVSGGWGAGLGCWHGADVQVKDGRFIGNTAGGGAGGVGVWDLSSATLTGCILSGNAATGGSGGGGLHVTEGASAVVEYSVCSGNSGNGDGGAMAATGDADLTVQGCTLVGNEAPLLDGHGFGGAICAWSARVTVANSVLYTNSAIEGTAFGMLLPFPGVPDELVVTVASSVIQDGQTKRAVYIEDPSHPGIVLNWGADNFDSPPRFRRDPSPGPDGTWGTPDDDFGDLHLLPGSPCIDAGDPEYVARPGETDIDGDPRVLDGDGDGVPVIDIGADEYVGP